MALELLGRVGLHRERHRVADRDVADVGLVHHGDQLERAVLDDGGEGRRVERRGDGLAFLRRHRGHRPGDGRTDHRVGQFRLHHGRVPARLLELGFRVVERQRRVLDLALGHQLLLVELLRARQLHLGAAHLLLGHADLGARLRQARLEAARIDLGDDVAAA